MAKRPHTPEDEHLAAKHPRTSENSKTHVPPRIAVSPALITTPWKSSEIPQDLPPLPTIKDSAIEQAVFVHRGLDGDPSRNYERLEWVGDAYLETIATTIIFITFPDATAGQCSQLREQLVRNVTLADYFHAYNLKSRARIPDELTNARASSKNLSKVYGDIFEAYVGAIITADPEQGLATATSWLKALWGRTIKGQIIKEEERQKRTAAQPDKQKVDFKTQLAQRIVAKGIKISYDDLPNGNKKDRNLNLPLFTVGAHLHGWGESGKLLGIGTALGKKGAAEKAAEQALQNHKLLKVYEAKKRALVQAQATAAARNSASRPDAEHEERG